MGRVCIPGLGGKYSQVSTLRIREGVKHNPTSPNYQNKMKCTSVTIPKTV